MAETQALSDELAPLDIKCTSTKCDAGLHCFRSKKRRKEDESGGIDDKQCCRTCGTKLVDWNRLHQCRMDDVTFTFEMLRQEYIRHSFWHRPLDEKAVVHARRKGKQGMQRVAEQRIRKSVGPKEPSYDGRQTPKIGNVLFYAQHATATCCRKCIEEWHGVPKGRELTEDEIRYFSTLISRYAEERLPDLTEEGEFIPVQRIKRTSNEDQGSFWEEEFTLSLNNRTSGLGITLRRPTPSENSKEKLESSAPVTPDPDRGIQLPLLKDEF